MAETYTLSNISAFDLKNTEIIGKQDPYAVFEAGKERFHTKEVKKGGSAASWNDVLEIKVPSGVQMIKVLVYNDNAFRPDSLIGQAEVSLPFHGREPRIHLTDKKGNPSGEITFTVSSSGGAGGGMGGGVGGMGQGVGTGAGIGQGGHHHTGAGLEAGAAGAGLGTAAAAEAAHHHGHHPHGSGTGTAGAPIGIGSQYNTGTGAEVGSGRNAGMGGGYDSNAPGTGHHHHHHGAEAGAVGAGMGAGRDSAVGGGYESNAPITSHHHHGPGTDTGYGNTGSGMGGMGGGYHHESNKQHSDKTESYTEHYGPGGEPTMTQRAKHAANEGMQSVKDHIPGMGGNNTTGSGYDNTRY